MKLSSYLASQPHGAVRALARQIRAHEPDVSRWASGRRPIPVRYGALIEQATGGAVTRQEMFPEDWPRIWPELSSVAAQVEQQPQDQETSHVPS